MSNKAASLTSDQIDNLPYSARYGDLEDLQANLSPLLSPHPHPPSELLATIKNEDSNTLLHCTLRKRPVVQYLLPFLDLSLSL
ncbi:hypothetical protein PHBOTO_006627 [Pseudozyma hubeiensis]|nr:hypothetical protein PHBOTO_006627 [Pseudozyma hubeiensis]